MKYYGISTGTTGNYGVGDMVESDSYSMTSDGPVVDGEPCFYVFIIVNGVPSVLT